MNDIYHILVDSRKIEKDFHKLLDRLNEEQHISLRKILTTYPKGTSTTHWKIKKVKKDIWQCDLHDGYRIAYTILDKPSKTVLILFAGNHDDAAAFLRDK